MEVIDKENDVSPSLAYPVSPKHQQGSPYQQQLSPSVTPLTTSNTNYMNTLNSGRSPLASPAKLGSGSPLRRKGHNRTSSSASITSNSSANASALQSFQKDYSKLERQYTELLMKNNNLVNDYQQLEYELSNKNKHIKDQHDQIANYEKILKNLELDHNKRKELYEQEILYYKDLIDDLQIKVDKLSSENDRHAQSNQQLSSSMVSSDEHLKQNEQHLQLTKDHSRLLKDYKILQSNFEIEQNSKLVLIDQIEYLTREYESRTSQSNSPIDQLNSNKLQNPHNLVTDNHDSARNNDFVHYFDNNHAEEISSSDDQSSSIIHNLHYMNNFIQEAEDGGDDTDSDDNSGVANSHMLSGLVEDLQKNKLESSSPIKTSQYIADGSIEISNDFQFPPSKTTPLPPLNASASPRDHQNLQHQYPPSPDPQTKSQKRQSLPTKMKSAHNSPLADNDEFVLSPLKLTNANTTSFFDIDTSATTAPTHKRYSSTKPNHSRYNSHDIVPIKVEFEPVDSALRSTSVPERDHLSKKFDIIDEENQTQAPSPLSGNPITESISEEPQLKSVRNSAFSTLNGSNTDTVASNRNSTVTSHTNASSKRSSIVIDHGNPNGLMNNSHILGNNDITKQEIMKLKFELQSLRLHNEKLLSYIGFELQKQKKNIKKIYHKQSLSDMRNQLPATSSSSQATLKSPRKRVSRKQQQQQQQLDKRIEYSDAKLIEKSRDMLIHKKRVLRSVSINPILSKRYSYQNPLAANAEGNTRLSSGAFGRRSVTSSYNQGVGIGLIPFGNDTDLFLTRTNSSNEDRFSFSSDFINNIDGEEADNDEDEYGFMKHNPRFKQRIFSNGINEYLNYVAEVDQNGEFVGYDNMESDEADCDIDYDEDNDVGSVYSGKKPRKYRSQAFSQNNHRLRSFGDSFSAMVSDQETSRRLDDDTSDDNIEDWEDIDEVDDEIYSEDASTDDDEYVGGMFQMFKSMCFGQQYGRESKKSQLSQSRNGGGKRKRPAPSGDDNLKYKFLTLAFGIMLIGIRCSNYQTTRNAISG